jgi:hypothetical protein
MIIKKCNQIIGRMTPGRAVIDNHHQTAKEVMNMQKTTISIR